MLELDPMVLNVFTEKTVKMKKMLKSNGILNVAAVMAGLVLMVPCASALELITADAEGNTLNLDGTLQMLGVIEGLDDPYKDSDRLLLFMKQARLHLHGTYSAVDYELRLMFGGEEVPESNTVMSLLDASANIPFVEDAFEVKLGQFKVPYGRERLVASEDMFNAERSIHNLFFNIGRDVGVAAHTRHGIFTGAVGVFTGGGINRPQRYIPEDLDLPMFVARVGVNDGLDKDVFNPIDAKRDMGTVNYAAFLNAMVSGDSRVGHSSPVNIKKLDKPLTLNPDWNPYVAAAGQKAELAQFGADVAVQFPVAEDVSLLLSGEVNYSTFENDKGKLEHVGGVASANLFFSDWMIGIRYAIVDPDSDLAYTLKNADTGEVSLHSITDKPIHEITPSVVYFLRKYNVKIVADIAIQLDAPVAVEAGNGVYNLMQQPDQVKYVAKSVELQDTYLAKMVVQYNF